MSECLFCKIGEEEIPSERVFEDADIIAFRDIHPKAPVHILIMPKVHIASIALLKKEDEILAGKMIGIAKMLAAKEGLEGYKLVFNVGKKGGQIINHLHLHLMGGWDEAPGKVEV